MLENMRKQGASLFVWIIFGILIAMFVVSFGPQSVGSSQGCSGGGGKTTALVVGDTEIDEFHALMEANLFQPVTDPDGNPLFPVWRPSTGNSGQLGASCTTTSECGSGSCAMVTPTQGLCTKQCTRQSECNNGTVCAGMCLPKPKFPVMDASGGVLFDATGKPNLENPALKPYKITGFRAPQLGLGD